MVAKKDLPAEQDFSPAVKLAKAKALYVVKGVERQEIAKRFNVPPATVSTWINRGGWVAEKEKRLENIEKATFARANDQDEGFLASMASQSEELAEDSMQMARDAITEGLGATRELQQASQSVKNFVDVYFKARKLDRSSSEVNVRAEIVLRLPGEDPPINVTPVEIDRKNEALHAPRE